MSGVFSSVWKKKSGSYVDRNPAAADLFRTLSTGQKAFLERFNQKEQGFYNEDENAAVDRIIAGAG